MSSANNINESVGKLFLPKFLTDLFNSPAANERVAPNISEKLPENAPSWMPKMLTNILDDSSAPLNPNAKEYVPPPQKRLNPAANEFIPASGGRRRSTMRKHRKASRKVRKSSKRSPRRRSSPRK